MRNVKKILMLMVLTVSTINAMVYENAEDGSISRWTISDSDPVGAVVSNIYDEERESRVIDINGSSYDNQYMIGNQPQQSGAWSDSQKFYLLWSMKNSSGFLIDVILETQNGLRYIRYSDNDIDIGMVDGFIISKGIGYSSADGVWHNFSRDLEADLQEFESNNSIISVNGLMIRGDCRVDDIELVNSVDDINFALYENSEDSSTSRWVISDNGTNDATIANIVDSDSQSRVIELNSSDSYANEYKLGDDWNNQKHFNVTWDMKTLEGFIVDIVVSSTDGERYLRYSDEEMTVKGKDGFIIYHGLGYYSSNGDWNHFERDLQKDLKDIEPNNTLLSVKSFLIRANCRVDNIELHKVPSRIYEDAEDNKTERWSLYSGATGVTIENLYDLGLNSRVISLQGDGMQNIYIIGGENINDINSWGDETHSNLTWSIKNTSGFVLSLVVNTSNGIRYINYSDGDFNYKGIDNNTIYYGLGNSASNGEWHRYIRDISADIKEFEPNNEILYINGVMVTGSVKIDNLELFSVLHPTTNRAGVSLTFDDTTVDSWFAMRPIFNKYGAKSTFFVSHFHTLDTPQIDKLKTLESDGSEIAAHTYDHRGVTRDYNNDVSRVDEYMNDQIIPVVTNMQNEGFNPVSFAYPYGEHEEHFDTAVRAYLPYIRLTYDNSESRLHQQNAIVHQDSKKYNLLSGAGIDNYFENNIDEIEEAMIKARREGKIITFYAHNIVDIPTEPYAISPDKLEKIISIAKDIGLKFYTFKEAYPIGNN